MHFSKDVSNKNKYFYEFMNSGKYKHDKDKFSSFNILFWFESRSFDLVKTISNSFVQISESITINFNTNICANKQK